MFEHESVQIILGVYMIFAMIVGTVVIVGLIGFTILWPLGKTIVNKLRRRQEVKYEPLQWNPAFETFDRMPDMRYRTVLVDNDQTQTLPAPEMSAADYPGLSWFSGRPLKADSEDTQFMEKVDVMHHQL